ncbi:hypothetical protein [Symmachiella dynata]|nr:hypothetical protein [Symmachiella dynata]
MVKKKPKSLAIWFLGILLALSFSYVLSFGPAAWLAHAGYVSDETMLRGYGPILRTAANRRGSIESVTLWYAGLTALEREKPRLTIRSFEIESGKAVDVYLRWDGGPSLENRW